MGIYSPFFLLNIMIHIYSEKKVPWISVDFNGDSGSSSIKLDIS
jgi:hypothetical protein